MVLRHLYAQQIGHAAGRAMLFAVFRTCPVGDGVAHGSCGAKHRESRRPFPKRVRRATGKPWNFLALASCTAKWSQQAHTESLHGLDDVTYSQITSRLVAKLCQVLQKFKPKSARRAWTRAEKISYFLRQGPLVHANLWRQIKFWPSGPLCPWMHRFHRQK